MMDWFGALISIRKETDLKIRLHRLDKPAETQGLMALKARKNGIQACINELVRLERLQGNRTSVGRGNEEHLAARGKPKLCASHKTHVADVNAGNPTGQMELTV